MPRTVLQGLSFSLASYLVSLFTLGPRTRPKMRAQLFAKVKPPEEAYGCISTLVMGWGPLRFPSPRSLPEHVQIRKSSLTSGVGTLSLCFSRAQFFLLAFSLECLGENRA